ncbi:MAG: rod shape-determining protein MreC [Firmicutes bacterium]|nr:rod shape-determining protein MreC [Bacillota bacterium]
MKWIREHRFISALIGVLIITLLILGISIRSGIGPGGFINRVYMAIEKPISSLGTTIKKNVSGIFSYRELINENEELREENEKLRNEISQLTFSANELQQLQELSQALNYDFIQNDKNLVTAKVTSLDGTNWTNSFTIDKGTESGIQAENIVLCGQGLVGRVSDTGEGWSKIVPIIDESSRISFYVEGTGNMLGIIEGSEDGSLTGFMLDSNAEISEGDRIITSGIGRYPAGIILGRVVRAGYDSNKQLMELTVKPEVDFTSIDKVSVII